MVNNMQSYQMSQKPENKFWAILLVIVALGVLLSFTSCSSSKKSGSSKSENITIYIRDTVHVKVVDTSKITTELQEFITKTIEIFDTTYTDIPRIRQRIVAYRNGVLMSREIKSVDFFITNDPYFNAFPSSSALKVHILDASEYEPHLQRQLSEKVLSINN